MTNTQLMMCGAYAASLIFLGVLAMYWSQKDASNRTAKMFVFAFFLSMVVSAVGLAKSGFDFTLWNHINMGISVAFSLMFFFATGSGTFATFFRLLCLSNIVGTIIYFSALV